MKLSQKIRLFIKLLKRKETPEAKIKQFFLFRCFCKNYRQGILEEPLVIKPYNFKRSHCIEGLSRRNRYLRFPQSTYKIADGLIQIYSIVSAT